MRRFWLSMALAAIASAPSCGAWAEPTFVNGLVIPGDTLDATGKPGANAGRFGFFSDLYYDPVREEWWALSDRGPGGGVLDYSTRVQRFTLDVHPATGRISKFRVKETIKFTDPKGLLSAPTNPAVGDRKALNGLNPLGLNGNVGLLGRSFDPEGLVIDPRSCRFLVSDEYGPSVYEFSRTGTLVRVFQTPGNLVPKVSGAVNYVADRDGGQNAGRQDNRGFEGLAITPDGKKLYAVLQDPLVNEPTPNNGRNGRNLRIVVFDNDRHSPTYGASVAQYASWSRRPTSPNASSRPAAWPRPPIPGRAATSGSLPSSPSTTTSSSCSSATTAGSASTTRWARAWSAPSASTRSMSSARRTSRTGPSPTTAIWPVPFPPSSRSPSCPTSSSISPRTRCCRNGKQAEKWEGITIGPRLKNGGYLILAGNDNDYSVTQQAGSAVQFDVYVNFDGGSVQRDIDRPTMLNGQIVGPVPAGYILIPGVLHAYKASAADLSSYVRPGQDRPAHQDDDDSECERDDHGTH